MRAEVSIFKLKSNNNEILTRRRGHVFRSVLLCYGRCARTVAQVHCFESFMWGECRIKSGYFNWILMFDWWLNCFFFKLMRFCIKVRDLWSQSWSLFRYHFINQRINQAYLLLFVLSLRKWSDVFSDIFSFLYSVYVYFLTI